MKKHTIKNYYEHPPKSGLAKQLVILLHGLGSNGRDLISLAPYWQTAVPDALFVSPDAPFACDMVPAGYPDAYQWFSLQSRDPKDMLEGAREAAPILKDFIKDQLEIHAIEAGQCALVGFSQGTMMSLSVAPFFQRRLAGVLGYSGALLWDNDKDITKAHKIPIHLIHGEADDVVPVEAYHMARQKLEHEGFDVSGHTTPMLAHSIDNDGIESGAEFLKSILNQ
ncbi:MAG: phospholipase [Micavibrio sp.]|nr:phospholipase [Micavibrio sp.]|tara:strand:- start:460 stop:1131 length:672 start_codon:yes stop_codon:yes gene_type:complete